MNANPNNSLIVKNQQKKREKESKKKKIMGKKKQTGSELVLEWLGLPHSQSVCLEVIEREREGEGK